MKYLRLTTLILFIIFLFYFFNSEKQKPINYYTSLENYSMSIDNQELIVPIFSSSNEVIFSSNRPNFYICNDEISYQIKKESCRFIKDLKLINQKLKMYLVSFRLSFNECIVLYDAAIKTEYNGASFKSQIGQIDIKEKGPTMIQEKRYFKDGIVLNGKIEPKQEKNIKSFMYNEDDNETVIYFNNYCYTHYIYNSKNDEYYKIQNNDIDLLLLPIYEAVYVED